MILLFNKRLWSEDDCTLDNSTSILKMGVKAVAAGVTVYFGTGGSNRYMPDGKTTRTVNDFGYDKKTNVKRL